MRRTIPAAIFAILAAFILTGAPAAWAAAAGIDIAGPRHTYHYYSAPDLQNLVGMKVVTRCPDVPVDQWGDETLWFKRFNDWVQCP